MSFDKLIERSRWVYDQVPFGIPYVLDIGCFDGEMSSHLQEKVKCIIGIDLDFDGLIRGTQKHPEMRFTFGSAIKLPFNCNHFDCVILSETLEHIPLDKENHVVVEIFRVLKPSGLLILTVPHAGLFQYLDTMNLRRNLRQILRKIGFNHIYVNLDKFLMEDKKGHKHFTFDELEALLGRYFNIIHVEKNSLLLYPLSMYFNFIPKNLSKTRLFNLQSRMRNWDYRHSFGKYSFNIALVAKAKHFL